MDNTPENIDPKLLLRLEKCGVRFVDGGFEVKLSLHYSSGDPIYCPDFAESITGTRVLINESKNVIAQLLLNDQRPESITVCIDTLLPGSKISNFTALIKVAKNSDVAEIAKGIVEKMESRDLANVLMAGIAAVALYNIIKLYVPEDKQPAALSATNSIVVNAGHDMNIPPDTFRDLVGSALPNTARAGKAAVQMLQPVVGQDEATMTIGKGDRYKIPNHLIQSLPRPEDINVKEVEKCDDHTKVKVKILASDSGKKTAGWAVVLPAEIDENCRRIKAKLGEGVEPAELMYKKRVVIDLTLIRKRGNPRIAEVLIRKVYPNPRVED